MNPPDDKDQVMQSDLAAVQRDTKPKKTWFFERMGDGMVFPCEEKEAWDICNNRSEWKRKDFKLLGTSDGTTYQKVIAESRSAADRLSPIVTTLEKEVERYVNLEEKFMLENIVDMDLDDELDAENAEHKKKVLKIRGIIDRKKEQLASSKKEYQAAVSGATKAAIDAELEVAKENMRKHGADWPGQVNIITPDATPADRAKILNQIKY